MFSRLLLPAFLLLILTDAVSAKPLPQAQPNDYLYDITGNPKDVTTKTTGGLMLMGGGTDVDHAFQWMIKQSRGGDFVVIRASGTDAYNPYIARLGPLDSFETIIFQSRAASTDPFVVDRIRNAEAL